MKKTVMICALIFGGVALHAQTKPGKTPLVFTPRTLITFSDPVVITKLPVPALKPMALHYKAPPLPFFCGMEDKFRNRFNVFLKLRAGTDDAYEKMIHVNGH